MSLLSAGTGTAPANENDVENNGFWPAIALTDFRNSQKVDNGVTTARLTDILRTAIQDINRQLADWQATQEAAGAIAVDDVAIPSWATDDHFTRLYQRAVFAYAQASLLERYRDYSATPAGEDRGEQKDISAEDYRRDSRWAVAEILGKPHTTVELI